MTKDPRVAKVTSVFKETLDLKEMLVNADPLVKPDLKVWLDPLDPPDPLDPEDSPVPMEPTDRKEVLENAV